MTLLNLIIYVAITGLLFFVFVPYVFSWIFFMYTTNMRGNVFSDVLKVSFLAPFKHNESRIVFKYSSIFLLSFLVIGGFILCISDLISY